MSGLILLPLIAQGAAMAFDEWYFHRRRGLPRWERIGHPLDTLTVLACFGLVIFAPTSGGWLKLYLGLALFSAIFVTKDEFVHARACSAEEHWLHAVLFILHPLALLAGAVVWPLFHPDGTWQPLTLALPAALVRPAFIAQFVLMTGFFIYQIVYWNILWKEHPERAR